MIWKYIETTTNKRINNLEADRISGDKAYMIEQQEKP